MKRLLLVMIPVLMLFSCCHVCHTPASLPTKYIKDAAGRSVIYNGANICNASKHCNQGRAGVSWEGPTELLAAKAEGRNVARYLVFWEALEPTEGQFDTVYLKAAVAKAKEVIACSLDVIVDLHQDLFAQRYGGDGFPDWMVKDNGKSFKANTENWALNYLQPAVLACFDNFWNDPKAQDKYARALKEFVKAFDTIPGVVGYDVMNEPFPGAMIPNVFEEGKLTAFYQKMLATIRESSSKLMFYEPWMSTSAGIQTYLKFKPDSLCVYAPHYYNLICESHGTYNIWNTGDMRCALKMKADEARGFGVPMLLGEFGISDKSNRFYGYLMDFAGMADQYGFGWSYWSYDRLQECDFGLMNNDGTVSQQALALRRTYPQRIAGDNPSWWFNGKKMSLSYTATGLKAPTVVFIPVTAKNVVISVNGTVVQKQQAGSPFVYQSEATGPQLIEVTQE